jgi:hypothetical protein
MLLYLAETLVSAGIYRYQDFGAAEEGWLISPDVGTGSKTV